MTVTPPAASRIDLAVLNPDPVSFAPPGGVTAGEGEPALRAGRGHEGHGAIAVGPARPSNRKFGRHAGILDVSGLPIHASKIHRPLLPEQTLSRERLNGWLDVHTAQRIVVIVAEAGFGKTTLLADWSRRSQRRCLWYRLESDDRDWLGFVRHVVGSGREADDGFMPRTLRMLTDLGPGGPTRDQVIASFLTELASEAQEDPHGITLILDDYHNIDGGEEIVPIMRGLLDRTGNGLTVVIASRALPALPLGRFRAQGGVAQLDGEDLCFALDETERLFRETYDRPLEPDVLEDLVDRTDGWPAALRLVRSAIEDRTALETRSFIRDLTGAHAELHDFLAEEVVGSLPTELQHFLMRTSILDAVDPRAVEVVDPPSSAHLDERIVRAEHLGLLARPDVDSPHRFHPLVRDFLHGRLTAEVGPARVREMHLEVGRHFEGVDWRISATHYSRGGDQTSVDRVVDGAIDQILGEGSFLEAEHFVLRSDTDTRISALIVRSRAELARGEIHEATGLAEAAVRSAEHHAPGQMGLALLNLATLLALGGPQRPAVDAASAALGHHLSPSQRDVAQALIALWEAAHEGDLGMIARLLRRLADRQTANRQYHYAAVTRLNLSLVLFWRGEASEALRAANEAEGLFLSSSRGTELGAVAAARARALAHLNRMDDAHRALEGATADDNDIRRYELLVEGSLVHCLYGDVDMATSLLEMAGQPTGYKSILAGPWSMAAAELALRRGDLHSARAIVAELIGHGLAADAATLLRTELLLARTKIRSGEPATDTLAEASRVATVQRSRLGQSIVSVLTELAAGGSVGRSVTGLRQADRPVLSLLAEELTASLHRLTPEAATVVRAECRDRPSRWRSALLAASAEPGPAALLAADLLSAVGDARDLRQLRTAAQRNKLLRTPTAALARRLALPVCVHDLGPVSVQVGDETIPGHRIRRRVLALLCFLIARPAMAASRDEALDQLWPELPPDTSVNSLNQTIYFLRRIFAPEYREGFTPGYVRFDGETLSLDPDLIKVDSHECRKLVAETRRGNDAAVEDLARLYRGKFALDFAYEEWSLGHRDRLHAAVLGVLEQGIERRREARHFADAIELAQRALEIEPESDEIQLALLRLYRATGQHAAAAEQYAHYASTLREGLGVEPPPFDDL